MVRRLLVPMLVGMMGMNATNAEDQTQGVRVAICQIFCLDGDRSGNFRRIENALAEARDRGADLACFPETALLGWVNPEAHERAHPIPGPDSRRLCDLAREYGLYLCIGLAEKEGDRLYDSALLIDDRGEIRLKHRKINLLTHLMDPPYTPGEDVAVAETPLGRIGVLICADTFVGEILERMNRLNPDLVLVPYGWAAPESAWPGHGKELEKTVLNAASAMGTTVVGTDLVGEISHGPWRGQVYGGQSLAADSRGRVLGRGPDRDRAVTVIDLHRQ